jgi:hypothetical protein
MSMVADNKRLLSRPFRPTAGHKEAYARKMQIALRLPEDVFSVVVRMAEHADKSVNSILSEMIAAQVELEWHMGEMPEHLFDGWQEPKA